MAIEEISLLGNSLPLVKGTLVLVRSDVEKLLVPEEALAGLRQAFQQYYSATAVRSLRSRSVLHEAGVALAIFPGIQDDIPAYTVKVHSKFPSQKPAIRGLILLFARETGELLAVMDSTYITAVRTGLSAALATDVLSRSDSKRVAVVGTGAQGSLMVEYLIKLRPHLEYKLFDTDHTRAKNLAKSVSSRCVVEVAKSLQHALSDADIVLTSTWASKPFLDSTNISPGTHITTLGSDEPGKLEIAVELLNRSALYCDDLALTAASGIVASARLSDTFVRAELGEVLRAPKLGRQGENEISVYAPVGLAFQDLVVSWQVYKRARNEFPDVFTQVDFNDMSF